MGKINKNLTAKCWTYYKCFYYFCKKFYTNKNNKAV